MSPLPPLPARTVTRIYVARLKSRIYVRHILQRGIPFEMKLPSYEEPIAYQALTKEQFNAEIEKGMEDIKAGKVYSADEIEAEMKRELVRS